MAELYFEKIKLPALGKQGLITPDSEGYYEMILGGLNTYNNNGAFYSSEGMNKLIGPGSVCHRRLANGSLRAEVNHPKKKPGMTDNDLVNALLDIDLNNVCAHIKAVWIDDEFGKKHPEYKEPGLIAIMGLVKPIPPKGDILKEALTTTSQNICFSVRCLADETFYRGKSVRYMREILTFDLVNEGGINIASKWDSPATESIIDHYESSLKLTQELLARVSQKDSVYATESSSEIANVLQKKYFGKSETPVYARW
jgi:hypothetical protein